MFLINDELKEFLESGVAVVIGTADERGRPGVVFGWGPRISEDRSHVTLFLERARAATPLANLASTGQIAMTVASPVSVRSVQLKGRWQGQSEATGNDLDWVQKHRDAFLIEASLVGDPPAGISNLWMDDLLRIDFSVERAFDQTPGPSAGQAL